ncbi:GDP-L-fucose synthase [endosymbiont of unidentified scaly snail isolate Monju]|uniref:GDP-L-fucose synthase n=1 Tax=endosymbiont of unidentified scaly snail isolate Monju TaxID=1248727 RepID=UPI0003892368|nr:GDP-L-fucose synthase [endosymbiont of unidentified scaly snail isolate Monju]BAN68615.1 GDP-L-fucose synthase [endosymbiont of unidentified scaly snail isolate Monju]
MAFLDDAGARVYVAGHRGMVGSAILRALKRAGFANLLTRTSAELDLRRQAEVEDFFAQERPDYAFLAAARVGGILANDSYPADFLYDNLAIEANIIHAAHRTGVKKLLFLGSTCIYPKLAPQPLKEEYLLTGPLEPTNEWYAVAKIAGIKLCQAYRKQHGDDFISAMPTNLYGPEDNFDLEKSHVVPAMMRKMHEARERGEAEVPLWGTGKPLREFLHVDDLAEALLFLMQHYSDAEHVNVGVGQDLSIRELAETIARVVGYQGELAFDPTKPDGTPRKLVDTTKINALGWHPRIGLEEGLRDTYRWYLANRDRLRGQDRQATAKEPLINS